MKHVETFHVGVQEMIHARSVSDIFIVHALTLLNAAVTMWLLWPWVALKMIQGCRKICLLSIFSLYIFNNVSPHLH